MKMRMVMIGLFWASGTLAAAGLPDNLTPVGPSVLPAPTGASLPGKVD